jgi:predicted ATPase
VGELLLAQSKPEQPRAEACFRQALATAREQHARLWELRATTSLARLYRNQKRRQEAHDMLSLLFSRFAEGFHALDLREAKELLDNTLD